MRSRRWAWTHIYAVPTFVASVIAVVLAGSVLVAVVVFSRGGSSDSAGPADPTGAVDLIDSADSGDPPDSDSDSDADIDECVVGRWRVVSSSQRFQVGIDLTQIGEGAVFEFGADGIGTADYGTGARYEAAGVGEILDVVVSGALGYQYVAWDGTFQFLEVTSEARVRIDGPVPIEEVFDLSTDPVGYYCDGGTLSFYDKDGNYTAEYQRLDP